MQIGILEHDSFSELGLKALGKIGDVFLYDGISDLKKFIQDKDVIFIRLKYYIGEELLRGSRVKYLCSPTTGHTHFDEAYIRGMGIKVISLRGEYDFLSNIRATPEHAFGLILALLRNYKMVFLNEFNSDWDREKFRGEELQGKTVGILGMGRVGKILASYCHAFGARTAYYDPSNEVSDTGIALNAKSAKALIKCSDIVALCASYDSGQSFVYGEEYIDLLEGKYFVNISRGEILAEEYLMRKIQEGHFKGIALDVICKETSENNNLSELIRLTKGRNFILTPHIGGATYESMKKTEEFTIKKLAAINGIELDIV